LVNQLTLFYASFATFLLVCLLLLNGDFGEVIYLCFTIFFRNLMIYETVMTAVFLRGFVVFGRKVMRIRKSELVLMTRLILHSAMIDFFDFFDLNFFRTYFFAEFLCNFIGININLAILLAFIGKVKQLCSI